MRRRILFLFLLALIAGNAHAQRWKVLRYELTEGIGTTNILGDIGGYSRGDNLLGIRDFNFAQIRPSLDLGVRFRLYERQVIRLNLNYGYAYGTDQGSANDARNYTYTTNLFEQSLVYEYYLITEEQKKKSASIYNRRGMLNNFSKFGVYVFGGFGVAEAFVKNGKGFTPGSIETIDSRAATLVLPLGVGVKYILDERIGIGFEFGGRYTFSDMLDGYTSTISKGNDTYFLGSLHLTYRIKADRDGYPAFLTGGPSGR
ncbi:MAG: DUF6089 family protein [Bacteroidales bacterium]